MTMRTQLVENFIMSKQIAGQDSLYEMDQSGMPCGPTELAIVGKYHIREALDKSELEEAAARVLVPSIELEQWVGVSYRRLGLTFVEDVNAAQENLKARNAHVEASWGVTAAQKQHELLNRLTLGLLGLYGKIVAPRAEAAPFTPPHEEDVFSGFVVRAMFASDVTGLQLAIRQLIEQGYLRHEEERKGDDQVDVLYPTPALVAKILETKDRLFARQAAR